MELEEGVCQDCGNNNVSPGILITESNISGFNINEPVLYCLYCNSYSTNGKAFKNPQEIGNYLLNKRISENFGMKIPEGFIIKAKNAHIKGILSHIK